jgi:hypothetical protein
MRNYFVMTVKLIVVDQAVQRYCGICVLVTHYGVNGEGLGVYRAKMAFPDLRESHPVCWAVPGMCLHVLRYGIHLGAMTPGASMP